MAVDKIDTRHQTNWWLTSWDCPICLVTIRKHHRSRHFESKGHKARLAKSYSTLDSDIAFSVFLAQIDPRKLKGYEKTLYRQLKELNTNGQQM